MDRSNEKLWKLACRYNESTIKKASKTTKEPGEGDVENGYVSHQGSLEREKGRKVRGNRWTGGSHGIRSISVCSIFVSYLVCLLSWNHHVSGCYLT